MALLDVTTLAAVRAWKGLAFPGGASDDWINGAIQALSKRLEASLNRALLQEAQVEIFDVEHAGQTVFTLRGYPVDEEETFSVRLDTMRVWEEAHELTTGFYTLDATEGILIVDGVVLPRCARALRVAYTGGMAVDSTAFCEAYPDIEEAANIQINFWWEQRTKLGQRSIVGVDQSVVVNEPLNYLPVLDRVVQNYRRKRW